MTRRRVVLTAGTVVAGAAAAGWFAFWPRNGQPLPERERLRLLEQAGLPPDFPVHPDARRMKQPQQGGISYGLRESIPEVVLWHQRLLRSSGYVVFSDPVDGYDEELPRWVHFRHESGKNGSIIVRRVGRALARTTEVKILSHTDARLTPPPLPEGLLRP